MEEFYVHTLVTIDGVIVKYRQGTEPFHTNFQRFARLHLNGAASIRGWWAISWLTEATLDLAYFFSKSKDYSKILVLFIRIPADPLDESMAN